MVRQKTFKIIAIVSYLLIILMGDMTGLPFFFWLLFTLFDFGNIDQLFAFLAMVGLTLSFINQNKKRTFNILVLDIVSFLLLASPVVRRMAAVSIEKFNYLAFIIPTIIFVLFFLISIGYSVREYLQLQKASV